MTEKSWLEQSAAAVRIETGDVNTGLSSLSNFYALHAMQAELPQPT